MKTIIELKNFILLKPDFDERKMQIIYDALICMNDGVFGHVGKNDSAYQTYKENLLTKLNLDNQEFEWVSRDLGGKIVLPPFANTHTHLGMSLFRGSQSEYSTEAWLKKWVFPLEEKLSPNIVYYGALLSLLELSYSGCGAVADMYYFEEATLDAVLSSGMRANIAIDKKSKDTYGHFHQDDLAFRDFFQRCEPHRSLIRNSLHVHSLYLYQESLYPELADLSAQMNLPIQMHIAETRSEVEFVRKRFSKTPIEALESFGLLQEGSILAHAIHLPDEDIEKLKTYNIGISYNPTSNLKLASGIMNAERLITNKISFGIGTDGAGSNDKLDILNEIHLACLLQKQLYNDASVGDPLKYLFYATTMGHIIMGFKHAAQFKIGEKADYLIYDPYVLGSAPFGENSDAASTIVYSGQKAGIYEMMIDGELMIKDGTNIKLDEAKILRESSLAYNELHGLVQNND